MPTTLSLPCCERYARGADCRHTMTEADVNEALCDCEGSRLGGSAVEDVLMSKDLARGGQAMEKDADVVAIQKARDAGRRTAAEKATAHEVTTYILIRTERLGAVELAAMDADVATTVRPVDADTVWHSVWGHQDAYRPGGEGHARAMKAAKLYCWVGLTSDTAGDVVAMASREDGAPTFATVDPSWTWTVAKMDAIDFARCDRCGAARARKKVYMVRKADGSLEQLGGTCAKAASERLRAGLAWLHQVSRMVAGWGEEFMGTGRRTHADPALLLRFAATEIALHGYTKGGVTRDAVREAYLEYVGPGPRRLDPEWAAIFDAIDVPTLVEEVTEWAASMKDSDFSRNMAVALETGSLRLLGTLCYAPEGVRRAKEARAEKAAAVDAWAYDPAKDSLAAKLETFSASDLKMSAKVYAKAQEGQLSAGNQKKLDRCLSGSWTVMRARVFESFDYSTTYVTYQREDGARVTWAASGALVIEIGATTRLQAQVGELRESAKWGDERRIRRVKEV